MAKVKERGYSDKYLMKLWRDKVLHECLHSCVICGMSDQVSELECHHFVHRNHYLLRYDWRNGFPVCKYRNHEYDNGKGMSCHRYADTPRWERSNREYNKEAWTMGLHKDNWVSEESRLPTWKRDK